MKHELVTFARQLGVSAVGDKPSLTERIAAQLGGRPVPQPVRRTTVSNRIPEVLTMDTVLPPRQASSQQLKAFLVGHIGKQFTYDIHMRTYISSDSPKTIADVIAHWYATRNVPKPETLPQLELVRFMKAWHAANPNGTALERRAGWQIHKSLPIDQRPNNPGP
jgi:SAP domain-containing new25/Domain of unknown function (DUF6434)